MRRLAVVACTAAALLASVPHTLPAEAATVSARFLLSKLAVAPESGSATYARTHFRHWVDADRDSCDTREEVLLAESKTLVRRGAGCRILSGRWVSTYDARSWTNPSHVDVGHMVPLREAWESGARVWSSTSRMRFANDLGFGWSLDAMTDNLKADKRHQDPAQWLPPRAKCRYARHWVAVKYRWHLSIDRAEKSRLAAILTGACGAQTLSVPRRITVSGTTTAPVPTSSPSTSTSSTPSPSTSSSTASTLGTTVATPSSTASGATPSSGDAEPPTAPFGLTATVAGWSTALTWSASTDDVAVTSYDVHRSQTSGFGPSTSTLIASSSSTSFTDAPRPPGTTYYRVTARDAAGNVSAPSAQAAVVRASPLTVMTVGDIACPAGSTVTAQACRHGDVAQVVSGSAADYLVPLGDLQYNSGTYAEFMGAGAYNSVLGGLKPRTLPVIGNHEHVDPAGIGQGYYDYFYGVGVESDVFGSRGKGYYTRMLGDWQFIALNSECQGDASNGNRPLPGGCGVGSEQYQWLQSVLSASTAHCTLVAFHRPRWTTGGHSSYAPLAAMWDLMAASGVDVTVSGHNHSSEAFRRIGASGAGSSPVINETAGIRSFVAGGGGKSLYPFADSSSAVWQALMARDSTTFGPLRLTLRDGTFDWQFTPIAGQTFTNAGTSGSFSGTGERCH